MITKPRIDCPWRIYLEISRGPDFADPPIHHEEVTGDLAPLVEEAHTRAVLAGAFPSRSDSSVEGSVEVIWQREPFLRELVVELRTTSAGEPIHYRAPFREGRWSRRALLAASTLQGEGRLEAGELSYSRLVAERSEPAPELRLAPLEEPLFEANTLAEVGVRELGEEGLVPDRPVLVNRTLEAELIEACESAGPKETGGALLGQVVRLAEPLRGTVSPIVTVLTTLVLDERHVGELSSLAFSPEALAEASQIADLRGLGERVLTVAHTHGWGTGCGECNQSEACALPQCTYVSPQDYEMLEALFPSRATLLPIAGRKLGAPGRRPVLELHGWLGGAMKPLSWRRYSE